MQASTRLPIDIRPHHELLSLVFCYVSASSPGRQVHPRTDGCCLFAVWSLKIVSVAAGILALTLSASTCLRRSDSKTVVMEEVRLQSQKVLERWAIDAQDVELGEVLGQGAFSVVRAGTWQDGNSKVEVRIKPTTWAAKLQSQQLQLLHNIVRFVIKKITQTQMKESKAVRNRKTSLLDHLIFAKL